MRRLVRDLGTVLGLVLMLQPGRSLGQCTGDINGDGAVTVDEVVLVVKESLEGCRSNGERFRDMGDGTIVDLLTDLTWEQKVEGGGCLHCADDLYNWHDAMSEFASAMNGEAEDAGGPGLGGFSDWRLPSVDELRSIGDRGVSGCTEGPPCVSSVSGPPRDEYWSSISTGEQSAWVYRFAALDAAPRDKSLMRHVRAVRGTANWNK